MIEQVDKPPLGLTPITCWEDSVRMERINSIVAAMSRYCAQSRDIPVAWAIELLEKVKEQEKSHPNPTTP